MAGSMAVDPESALYKQALAEEAAVLGIRLPEERYLLHIAEEALLAEPPPPWKELVDPDSGTPYYLNTQTHESTWDNPALHALKQRVHAARQQHAMQQMAPQQQQPPPPRQQARQSPALASPAPSPRGSHHSTVQSSVSPPATPQNSQAPDPHSQVASSAASSAAQQPGPDAPPVDEDSVEYIVSRRVDKNSETGELEYKVHWLGTDATEDEWFLRGALVNDYPEMLAEYDRKEDARQAKKRADAAKASEAAKAAKAAEQAKIADRRRRKREEESRKVLAKLNAEIERLENESDTLHKDLFDVREDRDSLARKVKRLRTNFEHAEEHISRL